MPSADHSPGRLSALELAALVATVVLVRLFAVYCFPFYDDAFITFRYAANLASGLGLVFNPGAPWEPILGTTTPTYALLLGGLARLGLDPQVGSIAVNLTCDGVSALLLAHLLERRRVAAGLTLLAFATLPSLVRISVGGMEPSLLAVLALGAVSLARAQRLVGAGVLAAIACTVRPEAVLLVGVLTLVHVRSVRQGLALLAPVAVIGVAAAGTLFAVYGDPIPQSVQAKAGNHGFGPHLPRIRQVLEESFAPLGWTLLVLPIVVLGFARLLRREERVLPFAAFSLAMTAAYLAAGTKTWGWYYFVPLCAWCVALGLGLESLIVRARGLFTALDRALVSVGACLLGVLASYGLTRLFPDRVTPNVYEALAAWSQEVELARQDARVEASDIGAIGYFSGALVLDSEGLVWPEARTLGGQLALIEAHRPEYVLMVAERGRMQEFAGSPVFAEYRAIARFNAAQDDVLDPDPASLPEHWTQDYIIFVRRDRLPAE